MSSDSPATPGVGTRLGYLFKHVGAVMAALHAEALGPLGIDARELGVLLVIDSSVAPSQQEVAQRLGVDRTTMVAMLDALAEKGLLVREPDAGDRRRNVVALTAGGRELLARATAASDVAEGRLLAGLSRAEGEQLRELLVRVLAAHA